MEATTHTEPRTIHRATENRIIGGVAGGVARYFNIDPVIVRTLFVALTFVGGSGLALYLVGWLLIPDEGHTESVISRMFAGGRRAPRAGAVMATAIGVIVVVAMLSSRPWQPGWPVGFGSVTTGFALVAIIAVLVATRARGTARVVAVRALLMLVAIACLIVTLGAASVIALSRSTGVPLRGGVGDRVWQPSSLAELQRDYRLAVGNLQIDLSALQLAPGDTELHASVGVGRVVVVVPDGVDVSVSARSGIGDAVVFGSRDSGLGARRLAATTTSGARLVLDARAGVGEVDVIRSSDPRP